MHLPLTLPTSLSDPPEVITAAEDSHSLKRSLIYRWRIWLTVASLVAFGVLALLFESPRQNGSPWDHGMDGLGWLCCLSGISLRLWAALCIGGRKTKVVVDFGPYSLVRNPLYVGTFLLALAPMFVLQSPLFALSLVGPLALYAWGVVPTEERRLTARLGDEYVDYCRRVPRWIPALTGFRSGDWKGGVRTRTFRQELIRSFCWIWLPVIAELISHVREAGGV